MSTSSATFDAPVLEVFDATYTASNRSVTDFPGTFGRKKNLAELLLKCVQYPRVGLVCFERFSTVSLSHRLS